MENLTAIAECESSFGPAASVCSNRFDFTLLFEQSLMDIGPSVVLLLALPLRLQQLWRQRRKVLRHPLNTAKITACVAFAGIQIALLALWAQAPLANRTSIAAAFLGVLDALALGVLSHIEHVRSIRPSTIICLYLVFSIAFDAVQCRTLWLLPGLHNLATVFTGALAVKTTMFLLEVQGKRRLLLAALQHLGPEATSGIIARGFFWWLNDLMTKGFKATLSSSALYDIDDDLQSHKLYETLNKSWERRKDKGKHALLLSLCSSTRMALFSTAVPRFVLIGFKFAQPFLINRIITYVDGERGWDPKSAGYGLIAATGLVYLGNALSMGFYQHKLYRFITMIRGSLVSMILSKNLDLVASTGTDASAPLTLVNADVKTIYRSFEAIHEVWANVIEISIAIWLLQRRLGLGSLGPAITVIACAYGTAKLSKYMPRASKTWNEHIQRRVGVTSEILGSIKETKMLGMVDFLQQAIHDLRITELEKAKKFRQLITYMNMLGNAPSIVGPVITFGIAILGQRINAGASLSVATVFTSLSIITLIAGPLAHLISAVPSLVASLGSFERIDSFLRKCQSSTPLAEGSQTPRHIISENAPNHAAVEMSAHPSKAQSRYRDVVSIQNGCFALKAGDRPILRAIDLRIEASTWTFIIGRVGSGKTTLLRGLMGELSTTGSMKLLDRPVAYCAQTTWLATGTVKENILGQTPLDEDWYKRVVHACALDPDIAQLPYGDQTMLGSKGQSLSGGQRQRVALARAVYSRKHVLVVDDALSGLDSSTQDHIWDRLFSPTGLVRRYGASVILTTHSLKYLSFADHIVILGDDGEIARQGNFDSVGDNSYLQNLSLQGIQHEQNKSEDIEVSKPQTSATSKPQTQETDTEMDLLRKAGDTTLYWYYLKSIGWRYGLAGAVFLVFDCFFRIFPLLDCIGLIVRTNKAAEMWLKIWTEDDARTGNADTSMYFGVYAALSVVGLAVYGINIWIMFVMIVPKSSGSLHLTLLRSVMRAPLSFFVSTDTGDLINRYNNPLFHTGSMISTVLTSLRFSQDLSHIDRELPAALFVTCIMTLDCISAGILIIIGAKYLAAALPVVLLALYCLQAFYLRTSRQMRLLDLQAQAPLLNKLIETIDGSATIRAFGWQSVFRTASLQLLDQSQRPFYLLFCIQRWLTLVLDIFVGAIAVLLVSMAVLIPGATSTGAIAVALYNVLSFNEALAGLITSWTELETSLGAISRLRTFESRTPVEQSPDENQEVLPPHWPSMGRLEIHDITASYSAVTRPVLRNVSLLMSPGDKVAICGRTGSGKSSLTLTIFKLLDLDSGCITIDGVDISRVPNNVLRRRLIAIPQEPLLFPGTLRTNLFPHTDGLSLDEQPSDDDLVAALTKVSLWSAISLSGGLDTDVSHLALSKGQKQLLCLARAIVRKHSSRVLILDEATSAVDQETEEMMAKIIETEFAAHTVISVVHRPQALRGIQKVVTLREGKVASIGPPGIPLSPSVKSSNHIPDGSMEMVDFAPPRRPVAGFNGHRT
ncbi:Multidrug resistance-associated protein 1-like protein 3 [Colletotrichum chlorophyti]|uniref:Multidrug resistance-associated protein 1-like protein 3 n=1 Tax=Colletotrichum chlorophyti TaxID=708187 RepID=A0A1Q8S4D0_9PEZI|nr:Multidrug resistance-associated protein 1-like protein 3 [Colletotrichum chlorophyti]